MRYSLNSYLAGRLCNWLLKRARSRRKWQRSIETHQVRATNILKFSGWLSNNKCESCWSNSRTIFNWRIDYRSKQQTAALSVLLQNENISQRRCSYHYFRVHSQCWMHESSAHFKLCVAHKQFSFLLDYWRNSNLYNRRIHQLKAKYDY